MRRLQTVLAASALCLAFAPRAWALPVDWSGLWKVDGADRPRLLVENLPGELTLEASVPVEGHDETIELTGSGTQSALALDALWIEGIGFVGVLDNVPTKKKHSVSLRATADVQQGQVVVDAHFSVDGTEVKRETWRASSSLELVGLEASGKPLSGDYDVKRQGSLTAKFRVHRGALSVRAHVDLDPGHPYASFYGSSSTIFESSLGVLEPGDHELTWDGRDSTAAKRIALGGPYALVLEPAVASTPTTAANVSQDATPATSTPVVGSVSACFTVSAPRLELMCSDWPANYNHVTRPRWAEGPALAKSAAFLEQAPGNKPGLSFEAPRVLTDSLTAAGFMKQSSFMLVQTHGNVDSVWFFKGDPSTPWKEGAPEDGITGQYFSAGDLKDMHFAVALICDGAIPDAKGHSFVSSLRDAGCDVAIGFAATINVAETQRFRDVFLRFITEGSPVEKAARDATRITFAFEHPQPKDFLGIKVGTRAPSDAEMNALIDKERNTPADPNVDYGIKSLASSIVVERGPGIAADESMWPPRYGNSTN